MGWKNLLSVMGSLTDTFWKVPPYLQATETCRKDMWMAEALEPRMHISRAQHKVAGLLPPRGAVLTRAGGAAASGCGA